MWFRPLNERSLKLSHQNSSFFQTPPKDDEIKEFHKRRFSRLICHQMKVLGKWPEKLFRLDIPFEVTRATNHATSAENSSCVSPLYERKDTKCALELLAHFGGLLRLSGSRQGSGLLPQGAAVLPWAHHGARGNRDCDLGQTERFAPIPGKIQWPQNTSCRVIWGYRFSQS